MSLSIVRKQIIINRVAEVYQNYLRSRLTPGQVRRMNVNRYTYWWNKIAELLQELEITPEQWMEVQFHEFPRDACMQLFKLAAPPPQALCTPAAVDRFIRYVGRHDTLDVLDHEFIERKTYSISENFVRMLKSVNVITNTNSKEWMDLILIHVNSGDISLVWLCHQPEEWLVQFFERNGSALSSSVMDMLDNKIKREYLESANVKTIQ